VVEKEIISNDDMARALGHRDFASAKASIDKTVEKMSNEDILDAMDIWDRVEKLGG
jgi:hypothetical protein